MDKVSADSITQITTDFAYPDAKPSGPAPDADKMIADLRVKMAAKIQFLAKSVEKSSQEQQTAFAISRDKAQKELDKFDDFIAHVPNGFKLAPVWYSKVPTEQAHSVRKQFSEYVRPAFLRFLAANHADELKALGISPRGIERMKSGHNPINESGKMFAVNVDHIMELAGAGQASYNKETDPDMPAGSKPTYMADHFKNFVLLPMETHELKNMLNMLQGMDKIQPGHGDWILMMVPEKAPGYSGYVARPQHGPLKNMAAGSREQLAVQITNPLSVAVEDFFLAMNALENPEQGLVKSSFDEFATTLTDAFNKASAPRADIQSFRQFYNTELDDLREKMKTCSPDETTKLSAALRSINGSLRARFPKDFQAKKKSNVRSHVPKRLRAVRHG
jgi:hypothetical protein